VQPPVLGIVNIAAVSSDPRSEQVGYTLNEYFTGINTRNYDRTLAVLDPAGKLDPGNPAHVRRFTEGVSTSVDDHIVVRSMQDDAEGLTVRVTFRSRQAARYGPAGERCTQWAMKYVLSYEGTSHRILRSTATHKPCT
jgi:hypothetical protein